ncbi:MAG: alpha-mannosidase [Hamadaea sp.]|nr:alpha-mannosidase [Hamadaea sp.]NUT01959.1 alpha-mannosidase [Hamadaea sp.]
MTPTRTPTEIIVVPHTHWDREWYEPFQRFRLRLVALLDDVFDRMAADPRQRFTLDGQMAAVDDYLEVRPDRRDQVRELVANGQLSVGPWQILLDEFLCSGENIIRNLERGLRRAEELGAALPVGYLPDMFGHIAQMPQILTGAGLAHACVFRGVPGSLEQHAFGWEAPDGTVIRTEYLPGGYGNAASLTASPPLVAARAVELAAYLRAWYPDGGPMLGMYGTDHAAPAADVADLLARASAETGLDLRLGTLAEYFATQSTRFEGLPRITGELRSHARANILPGVISVRTPLKRAMGRAERAVERHAEPLAALWHTGPPVEGFLDMAWSRLIDASCHDSVTGCGCDETAVQVAARLAEADQLARAVVDLAGASLTAAVPNDGYAVWNPSPFERTSLVELDLDTAAGLVTGDGVPVSTQVLSSGPSVLADDRLDGLAEIAKGLRRIHGIELYGQEITKWELEGDELTFHVARHGDPTFSLEAVWAALADHTSVQMRIVAAPRSVVAAAVTVPALGHVSVRPAISATAHSSPVTVDGSVLDNGVLRFDVADLGLIVDGGDVGDSYNYAAPAADLLVSEPISTSSSVVAAGPLLGVVEVSRVYEWPVAASVATPVSPTVVAAAPPAPARSSALVPVTVVTRVELRVGEPFVRLTVSFDNPCSDHRVRLHLPTRSSSPSTASYAEGQFAVVTRPATVPPDGSPGEFPLPTFPASGFVVAGETAALLTQPTEYEVVDGHLAITLLRSVGMLSRNIHALRDEPAGPQLPAPQAQCHGPITFDLAVMPIRASWDRAGVALAAEVYRHSLLAFPGAAAPSAPLPASSSGLSVSGDGVTMTSLRSRSSSIELRVVCLQPAPSTAVVSMPGLRSAWLADLRGRRLGSLAVSPEGSVSLDLRGFEIATVQLAR